MCCRPENGYTSDPLLAAGKYGNYKCDIPQSMLVSMLEYARDEIKPDGLFWTGDNSAHNVWDNT
jgi:sphingomyelin phosphodiesterase